MSWTAVERLRAWEDSGATWRVVRVSATDATIDLCACTGEVMERLTSSEPDLLEFLAARGAEPGP
jgi:hypothetical protein